MNSFAALDSDNEDEVPVVKTKPVKKEVAKAAPAPVVVAPVKAVASSAKGAKVPGAPSAPKVRGKLLVRRVSSVPPSKLWSPL